MKKKPDIYLKKSEVLLTIQNYIREIQCIDGSDAGIPQLYSAMRQIDTMRGVTSEDRCDAAQSENPNILVRKAADGVYDIYKNDQWRISRAAPDNIISELAKIYNFTFIDEENNICQE